MFIGCIIVIISSSSSIILGLGSLRVAPLDAPRLPSSSQYTMLHYTLLYSTTLDSTRL